MNETLLVEHPARPAAVKTRCKFQVLKVADCCWSASIDREVDGVKIPAKNAQEITLSAVCSDKDSENISFSSATPTGTLTFNVTNPDVIGTFKPGAFYYIDLIPA